MSDQAGALAELQNQNALLTRRVADFEGERSRWADEREALSRKLQEEQAARKVRLLITTVWCQSSVVSFALGG